MGCGKNGKHKVGTRDMAKKTYVKKRKPTKVKQKKTYVKKKK